MLRPAPSLAAAGLFARPRLRDIRRFFRAAAGKPCKQRADHQHGENDFALVCSEGIPPGAGFIRMNCNSSASDIVRHLKSLPELRVTMKPSVLLARFAVAFVAGISTVASQTLQLEQVPRLPTPVVDPASDDAQLAIKRFSLPKGLKASLWAAEPMLANPVAIDFDESGRLFVSETYRYRTSVLDIRDYMPMLELDLAARTIEDRAALHRTGVRRAGQGFRHRGRNRAPGRRHGS